MKVTVLGTGAFGLALASVLVENKNEVVMWTTFEEEKKELLETKKSPKLEGFILDDSVCSVLYNAERSEFKSMPSTLIFGKSFHFPVILNLFF